MKIVVMGSGAIGSLYGGLLSVSQSCEVILVGRQHHVEAVNSQGLKITGVMGDHMVRLRAVESPQMINKADVVLITTKTYDSLEAAKNIKHLVDNGAYVVVIQNGIGTEKQIAEFLETKQVLRATTCMGALITGSGEVFVTGEGITEIGSHFPENKEMVERMRDLLANAGFEIRSSDNIEGVVWTKTIVNCGINPIGALTGLRNGEIYNNPVLRELVVRLVQETVEVSAALGIELTTDDPIRYALGTAKATSANINSMLQDIRSRKRTEIDSITGAVIRYAKERGIETPSSESVYALVKALESKYMRDDNMAKSGVVTLAADELLDAMSTF